MGISDHLIVESIEWPDRRLAVFYESVKKADKVLLSLRRLKLNNVKLISRALKKSDWQTKWKDEFKPFALTKSFGVIPMWQKGKFAFRTRKPIYIDTDLAFGTGLHSTTKYMAEFIERLRGRFRSFFDVGTGTGILAIMAAKCGASQIDAIDISPDSVNVAQVNFNENECLPININIADAHRIKIRKKYDLICANIITQDLIQMADKLVCAVNSGKYLAVSGISLNSYETFRKAYAKYPLKCIKIEKGDGWAAILFQKVKSRK
jgi:ribosomal protein L11 methyltransferase